MEGGKDPIFSFQPEPLFGKCFSRMTFCPKEVIDSWDHSMHGGELGKKKLKALSIQKKGKRLIPRPTKGKIGM